MDKYMLWLSAVNGFNGALGSKLLSHFGNAENVYRADKKELAGLLTPSALANLIKSRDEISPSQIIEGLEKTNTKVVFNPFLYDDKDKTIFQSNRTLYPKKLIDIPDPPLSLFYIGDLPREEIPSVAIIGARDCSNYGACEAREIGEYLGEKGIQTISGMARGIDGISQEASIAAGGYSYAVLGSGPDICYPRTNIRLYESLKTSGGIISLHPPGGPALPQNFPPRNRIVSGLADAIIVIEARQRSGTLITVDMALEQGRDVYAVPGRITDRLSDGCNGIIGQGANIFLSPDIFLNELLDSLNNLPNDKQKIHRTFEGTKQKELGLSEEQKKVYNCLEFSPTDISFVCEKIPEMTYTEILMILMQLVIDGHAIQTSQEYFMRRH